MDKGLRQILVTVVATLLAALIVAAFSAYVRLAILEERVAAQERRIDYFHGKPSDGEKR